MAFQQELQKTDPILAPESVPDRRAHPRYPVDCPIRVTLLSDAGAFSGRLANLSLGGCLVTTEKRLELDLQARVEVEFKLRGVGFRLAGVPAYIRGPHAFAIRFLQVPARRLDALAAVLLEEEEAMNAVRQAADSSKPAISPSDQSSTPSLPDTPAPKSPALIAKPGSQKETGQRSGSAIVLPASPHAKPRERRTSSRHAVDTRATLLLVKSGIAMSGRIHNLSLGGCQIRMEERFNVGIYVRIEAQFYLRGLPFRVGGVSQVIADKFTIGIRFLDLSPRSRERLTELIAEIEEAKAPSSATTGDPAEAAG